VEEKRSSRTSLLIGCFLIACTGLTLALSVSDWWLARQNHLYGTHQWKAGKDTGKFVFYSYAFMFAPFQEGRIDLASHMGYQEIRHRQEDTANAWLEDLSFETSIANECYLWVTLHARGNARLRMRISNSERHRNGFYTYDASGELTNYTAFDEVVEESEAWRKVHLHRIGETWAASMDGHALGTVSLPDSPHGWFGFQGSGRGRTHVYLREIDMGFRMSDGATSQARETFSRSKRSPRHLLTLFLVCTCIAGLRIARGVLLVRLFGIRSPLRFINLDQLLFLLSHLLAGWICPSNGGEHIAGAFVASELWTVLLLARCKRDPAPARAVRWGLAWALMSTSILIAAGLKHGEWLNHAEEHIWSHMAGIDPSAFLLHPDQSLKGEVFEHAEHIHLEPGKPWFPSKAVYREQEIAFAFTFHQPATLDIVFQQQAYQTRGDPEGEPLPLHRRLVRLSTYPGVTSGLAEGLHKQPGPFSVIAGLQPEGTNQIRLSSHKDGLEIDLNGTHSSFPHAQPLGFGETGFMVYESGVELHTIHVKPLDGGTAGWRTRLGFVLGILIVLPFGCGILLRLAGMRLQTGLLLGLSLLLLPAVFAGLSLILSTSSLLHLGAIRSEWIHILYLGCILGLAAALLFPREQMPRKALLFNLIFVLIFMAVGKIGYDRLPPEHSWKKDRNAVAPASAKPNSGLKLMPWYARNVSIGANNFVWHQRFGPHAVPRENPAEERRVFAMGGSQAWGSGAADSYHTYDGLLERMLQETIDPEIRVYNAGVNGAGISTVRDLYVQLVRHYMPELLILDIGLNDSASLQQDRDSTKRNQHRERMVAALEVVLKQCAADGVKGVLVLEAMSRESPLRPDRELYERYKDLAERYRFSVVDAMPETVRLEDDHPLWWDTAHLTPFGHEVLARLLREPVSSLLSSDPAP
jgi:lysophospholipase L1-like esterase